MAKELGQNRRKQIARLVGRTALSAQRSVELLGLGFQLCCKLAATRKSRLLPQSASCLWFCRCQLLPLEFWITRRCQDAPHRSALSFCYAPLASSCLAASWLLLKVLCGALSQQHNFATVHKFNFILWAVPKSLAAHTHQQTHTHAHTVTIKSMPS